jgi:hypothetical protein
MDDHSGRITIIASSTMVHHRVRCMICDRPVDHRVVFMTNDARVLHAGCVPDHVKVPIPVLLQAIRRLERMVDRARTDPRGSDPATALDADPDPATALDADPDPDPADPAPVVAPGPRDPDPGPGQALAGREDPGDPGTAPA